MNHFHSILAAIENDKRSVLATIIHVDGSSYRKEGATMLFQEDGPHIGVLSAGCLEEDLAIRAQEIMNLGISRTFSYNMQAEDDLAWGQGTGCNGVIHVLLEPISSPLQEHLCRLKHFFDQGISVMVAKKLTNDFSVSDYVFITQDKQIIAKHGEDDSFYALNHIFPTEPQQPQGIKYDPNLSAYVYIHYYRPQPRLLLFGAGSDVRPLASFAAQTGFSVTISDWRPALCHEKYFPEADSLLLGFPADVFDKLTFSPFDSVIIMTHHFARDKELLHFLMKQNLHYLGVLGPRARTSRLLAGEDIPSWIRSPVGLPIHAEGPAEIAISILADLIHNKAASFS
jgi:xanthine dehydrogenase accessory factor